MDVDKCVDEEDLEKTGYVEIPLKVSPRIYDRITKIQELFSLRSKKEAVRESLRIMAYLSRKLKQGQELILQETDGDIERFHRLIFLALEDKIPKREYGPDAVIRLSYLVIPALEKYRKEQHPGFFRKLYRRIFPN